MPKYKLMLNMSDGNVLDAGIIDVPDIDRTLTTEGAAADAQIVGALVQKIAENFGEIREKIEALEAVEIPSLDGYATEEFVNGKIAAIPVTDLSGYATEEYVQEQLSDIDVDLTGYATEQYVQEQIAGIEVSGGGTPPVFDLEAMGLKSPVKMTGAYNTISKNTATETEFSALIEALSNGTVTFAVPFDMNGTTVKLNLTMNASTDGTEYYCAHALPGDIVSMYFKTETLYHFCANVTESRIELAAFPIDHFVDKGVSLPEVDNNDDGKMLIVRNGAWSVELVEMGENLPEVTTEDAGSFLRVSEDGEWVVEKLIDASEVAM